MSKEYERGFRDGWNMALSNERRHGDSIPYPPETIVVKGSSHPSMGWGERSKPKRRKLSAWQKFVKANSKKPRFRYKSGAKKGKLNLKAMGVAYRKKKR